MNGFLNINKPYGITSHDCVAKIKRLFKKQKVGHGGTLDPAATGVLPIAVGKATRLLNFLPENKAYQAKIRLGVQTTTDDLEGENIAVNSATHLTLEHIQPLLSEFIGCIEQIPPAYSAIHKDGKRMYELAREGIVVDIPSRKVEISQVNILSWHPGETAELELEIFCGGGTYIRAIARDLGAKLGVGGTLAGLIRTLSCGMILENSLTLEELHQGNSPLIAPEIALNHLPRIQLEYKEAKRFTQGQKIIIASEYQNHLVLVFYEQKALIGLGLVDNSVIIPKIILEPEL